MSSIGSKSKVAKQERNIYTSNIRFTNPNQQAACTSLSVCYDRYDHQAFWPGPPLHRRRAAAPTNNLTNRHGAINAALADPVHY
jgi:hypothetical protein